MDNAYASDRDYDVHMGNGDREGPGRSDEVGLDAVLKTAALPTWLASVVLHGLNRGTWRPDRVMRDTHRASRPVPKWGYPSASGLDVIFVRHDRWTLGAPAALEAAAQATWSDQWVAVVRRSGLTWQLFTPEGQPL